MFNFTITGNVIFGEGVSLEVGKMAKDLGAKHALVVHDPGVKSAGIVDPILKSLKDAGLKCTVFGNVIANPTDDSITEAIELAKGNPIDIVIGFGGGSAMDSAKAINVLLSNEGPIQKYEGRNMVKNKTLPLIAIPTTSGTGSEVTEVAVITDKKRGLKMILAGDNMGPVIALEDPNLLLNLPASITASTGMDALTHAMESYLSVIASPITEMCSLKAVDYIYNNLKECVLNGQNIEARKKVMLGSFIAGFAFNQCGLGFAHGIAHPLGALFNIPHGVANAIALPDVIDFNGQAVPEKVIDLGKAMGLKDNELTVEVIVAKLKELNKIIKIPKLSEVGIKKSDFDMIAKATLNEHMSNDLNPRKVNYEDVIAILEKVF